jgi:hypothetical protein
MVRNCPSCNNVILVDVIKKKGYRQNKLEYEADLPGTRGKKVNCPACKAVLYAYEGLPEGSWLTNVSGKSSARTSNIWGQINDFLACGQRQKKESKEDEDKNPDPAPSAFDEMLPDDNIIQHNKLNFEELEGFGVATVGAPQKNIQTKRWDKINKKYYYEHDEIVMPRKPSKANHSNKLYKDGFH